VIGLPPSLDGGEKLTTAEPSLATAETPVGAPGLVAAATGTTLLDGGELGPVPTPFVAVTVNEYTSPFVNPETVIGLPVPDAV
jgi:hypothetical protein